MAKVLKAGSREFVANPGKKDNYRILSDITREREGIDPRYLNFDIRQLNPGQYSAPYHSHRYAEELFMLIAGSAMLRTPDGLEAVDAGDLVFCEAGEAGAHQFYNHTEEPCLYLDVRTSIGYDICDYPDSDKVVLAPSFEIFDKRARPDYFDGEENVREVWARLGFGKGAGECHGKTPGKGTGENCSGENPGKSRR